MKSWVILIIVAVALTAAFTVAMPLLTTDSRMSDVSFPAPAARPDGPAPVIEVVEPLVYNFGARPQWYTGTYTWTFKNTGAGPLELRGGGTTCSCTTAALFEEGQPGEAKKIKQVVVQPGESLPIEVTYNTKNWNNDKWEQRVTVGTNDPSRPTITLQVEGTVKPAITTVPSDSGVNFSLAPSDESTTRKVAFFSVDRPDVKALRVISSNPELIEAIARPMTPEEAQFNKVEKGQVVEITLKPTSRLGNFSEEVRVETDHPQKSNLAFKVGGKVTGPILVQPERAIVRGATTKDGGSELLKLVVRGRTSVNFTVEKKPKGMDLSIEQVPPVAGSKGSIYNMTVKVVPGADSGRIVDEIILKTDDPRASEVKVPVDVLVTGAR